MTARKTRWLLAGLLCLALWPGLAPAQSPELMEAVNRYVALYQQGRYGDAIPHARKAVELAENEFGSAHPDTAIRINDLAQLYQAQGHYAEAAPLFKRSLAIREKALGPEHPAVATSLENYAALFRQTARADEAESMEVRAQATRAKSE